MGNWNTTEGIAQLVQWVSCLERRLHQDNWKWHFSTTILWPQMVWRQKFAERALHIWPQIIAYISETLKKPKSNSYIKYIFYSEVCCPVQLENCKAWTFCISCSHPETLSGDLSVWCSTSAFYHLRTSSNGRNCNGEILKELEAASTPLKISKVN